MKRAERPGRHCVERAVRPGASKARMLLELDHIGASFVKRRQLRLECGQSGDSSGIAKEQGSAGTQKRPKNHGN